jgi:hypothetical protein
MIEAGAPRLTHLRALQKYLRSFPQSVSYFSLFFTFGEANIVPENLCRNRNAITLPSQSFTYYQILCCRFSYNSRSFKLSASSKQRNTNQAPPQTNSFFRLNNALRTRRLMNWSWNRGEFSENRPWWHRTCAGIALYTIERAKKSEAKRKITQAGECEEMHHIREGVHG